MEDARTLVLGDGRRVLLDGVRVEAPLRARAKAWLAARVPGRALRLAHPGGAPDRHGRLAAQVGVETPGEGMTWLQQNLVERGLARFVSFQARPACGTQLLAMEADARRARRAMWSIAQFSVRPAGDTESLSGLAGSYHIVEGRVRDVATVRGMTYLNFGPDYRTDFTATIARRDAGVFGGAEALKARFEARRVLVRGWIEERNGPAIRVTHPEQIRVDDAR